MSKNLLSLTFENYRGPNGRRLVLMALAKHANDDGTSCFPAVDTLAELAGVKRSTVQRSIHFLERQGVVTVLHRGGRGRGDVTKYQLHPTVIGKGRNVDPFEGGEKGRNEESKGPQPGTTKGRSGDPDSVTYSINDSTPARAKDGGGRSADRASARGREKRIARSRSDKPASRKVAEAGLQRMRDILGMKKKGAADK